MKNHQGWKPVVEVQAGERLVKPESVQNQRIACLGDQQASVGRSRKSRGLESCWKSNDSTRAIMGDCPAGAMEGLGAPGRFV
jgi:hypothetical protein